MNEKKKIFQTAFQAIDKWVYKFPDNLDNWPNSPLDYYSSDLEVKKKKVEELFPEENETSRDWTDSEEYKYLVYRNRFSSMKYISRQ